MNKKTTLKTLAFLAILICSIAAPILVNRFMVQASKSSYDSDYMTVSGVLSTDSYVLFPFEKKNLTIGFSKYGEMIDYSGKVGLNYNGETDPFAPGEHKVTETQWIEGWIINITYSEGGYYRNTWARATYSDYASGIEGIAGIWKEGCTDGSSGSTRGGRKTNGGAVTDSIQVLYNGPRKFVALLRTAIYKEAVTHGTPLVNLTFLLEFNKDKKQVVIFKDIKRTDTGKNIGDMQIEFSNRGEWDLGNGNPPKSYAHFYTENLLSTLYNGHYQYWYNSTNMPSGYNGTYDVCQVIDDELNYVGWAAYWPKPICSFVGATQMAEANRETILNSISTKTEVYNLTTSTHQIELTLDPIPYPQKNSTGVFWLEEPMVFVSDEYKVINGTNAASSVKYWELNDTVEFPTGYIPGANAIVKIVYKTQRSQSDMGYEPYSPFIIGEWDFKMCDATDMFRAVTIYGITDLHDGDDAGRTGARTNVLDAEVQYYLNETFNPYDLYSAVHKQEDRWFKNETLTSSLTAGTNYTLTSGLDDDIYQPNGYTYISDHLGDEWSSATWTGYNLTASGGATCGWRNEYENGTDAHSKNWVAYLSATTPDDEAMLKITPTGYGVNVTGALTFGNITDFGFWYYMLAGANQQGPHIEFELYNSAGTGYVVLGAYANSLTLPYPYLEKWTHYTLNGIGNFLGGGSTPDTAFYIRWCPDTPVLDGLGDNIHAYEGATYCHSWEWFQKRLGNFSVGSVGVSMRYDSSVHNGQCFIDDLSVAYLNKASGIKYERVYNMEEDKLIPSNWTAYCSFAERVLINETLAIPYRANSTFGYYNYTINFQTGNITFLQTLSEGTRLEILYSTIEENEKGRYEWMIVGKDAATIDSIGAAYITEAFDSTKDIAVLMTGMDINETDYGPHAPFVMGGALSGTKSDYRDSLGRPSLRDNWCNTIAISSSNMIFAGGPNAQMGTEYFNEFTDAFFARSLYVTNNTGCEEPHSNTILALSCWDRNVSAAGYAVIAVYKDLNGTIGLVIWGYDGQDTYYASKWFWDGMGGTAGIVQLQSMNRGVTSIVIKITYTDPTHPSASIVERLGTISEKDQHDC